MRVKFICCIAACIGLIWLNNLSAKAEDTYLSIEIQNECYEAENEFGICAELLMALIERESTGQADITNAAGTHAGLCQLSIKYFGGDGVDLYDAHTNIWIACEYILTLRDKYEDIGIVLMAYHGEKGAANKELSSYASGILTRAAELEEIHGGQNMTLYEIDSAILECVDEETGEVVDMERLDALEMERDKKIEGVALACKNLSSDIEALAAEKAAFDARLKSARNRLDGYKRWLALATGENKFVSDDQKVSITFRHSKAVDVTDMDALLAFDVVGQYIKIAAPEPRKTEIKKAIEDGIEIPGCIIVDNVSTIIK